MNNFVQPVLSITFGLHWHFDSSLSDMSSHWITVCFVTFGKRLKPYSKSLRELMPVLVLPMLCAANRGKWCQNVGERWPRAIRSSWNIYHLSKLHLMQFSLVKFDLCETSSISLLHVRCTSPIFYWDEKKSSNKRSECDRFPSCRLKTAIHPVHQNLTPTTSGQWSRGMSVIHSNYRGDELQ